MYQALAIEEAWLVYKATSHWYGRFLSKKFGHVGLWLKTDQMWLYFDPHVGRLQLHYQTSGAKTKRVEASTARELWKKIDLTKLDDTMCKFPMPKLGWWTCSSLVAYILGLKKQRFLTPERLHKYCSRNFLYQEA